MLVEVVFLSDSSYQEDETPSDPEFITAFRTLVKDKKTPSILKKNQIELFFKFHKTAIINYKNDTFNNSDSNSVLSLFLKVLNIDQSNVKAVDYIGELYQALSYALRKKTDKALAIEYRVKWNNLIDPIDKYPFGPEKTDSIEKIKNIFFENHIKLHCCLQHKINEVSPEDIRISNLIRLYNPSENSSKDICASDYALKAIFDDTCIELQKRDKKRNTQDLQYNNLITQTVLIEFNKICNEEKSRQDALPVLLELTKLHMTSRSFNGSALRWQLRNLQWRHVLFDFLLKKFSLFRSFYCKKLLKKVSGDNTDDIPPLCAKSLNKYINNMAI